jgi:hypothetical protein
MNRLFDDVFHGRSGDRMQDSSLQHRPVTPSIDVGRKIPVQNVPSHGSAQSSEQPEQREQEGAQAKQ